MMRTDAAMPPQLFSYRLAKRSLSRLPGQHLGLGVGGDGQFHRHIPLLASRDPKHLDLRACVLDVYARYPVRSYRPHQLVDVVLVADLSASMARQRQMLQQVLASVAASVAMMGDRFHFLAVDASGWLAKLAMAKLDSGQLAALAGLLAKHDHAPGPPCWWGLGPVLPSRRALVLLLTDGHFPLADWRRLLATFAGHALLPLVSWPKADHAGLPAFGLVSLADPESGRYRSLLLRPKLKQALVAAYGLRRQQLSQLCRSHGVEPLFLNTPYHSGQMQDYFSARAV